MSIPVFKIPHKLKSRDLIPFYLQVLGLTRKYQLNESESEILAAFIVQSGSLPITTEDRKAVARKMKMSNLNLNNHIFRIKGKGYIEDTDTGLQIISPACHFKNDSKELYIILDLLLT